MIISVWGNAGSGKSTLAIKLATTFARRRINTILVDTNYNAPQVGIWYPDKAVKPEASLSQLLDNNIDTESLTSKITVVGANLGLIGYAKDFSTNNIPGRSDTAPQLLDVAEALASVIIVDCNTSIIEDIMSFTALDNCDEMIVGITPDARGLAWYTANYEMLKDGWEAKGQSTYKLFNKVKITAPTSDMERLIGTVDYYLPFSATIEEECYRGAMGEQTYRRKARKYAKIIDNIVDEIMAKYDLETER